VSTQSGDAVETAPVGAVSPFRRVLLKLSGESMMGARDYGVDPKTVAAIAREVVEVRNSGTELAIVVGGGNFYRGMAAAASALPTEVDWSWIQAWSTRTPPGDAAKKRLPSMPSTIFSRAPSGFESTSSELR